jgi:Flp pilus assembly secretin CpaC
MRRPHSLDILNRIGSKVLFAFINAGAMAHRRKHKVAITMFRSLLTATAVAALSLAASAEEVRVAYDQSKAVKLTSPAKTVLVGNPLIAEATMIDPTTVYVLGRMPGQTNVVAVDQAGNEILNMQVSVVVPDAQVVTVLRGSGGRQTFTCAPRCEWTVNQGDDAFKAIVENADKKQSLSESAAKITDGR